MWIIYGWLSDDEGSELFEVDNEPSAWNLYNDAIENPGEHVSIEIVDPDGDCRDAWFKD